MWKIEYSKEVRNYLFDSYPYTETIWQTIKGLRQMADGLPDENCTPQGDDKFLWKVANHSVFYRRDLARNVLFFQTVKPDPDDDYPL